MKILKSLVSYIQNLHHAKFYSCKIQLVYIMFKKNVETSWHGQVKKPIIHNTVIIYNRPISVKLKLRWLILAGSMQKKLQNFSSISPKLCLLGQKNIGTLVVNGTILTPGLWL